ncbi:MAG: hypothetical protein AWU54_2368 [Candidatus Frackibacter sp. T328-2]|nr:MAG: hypothetical protein AWU54_2368 [Candidatus Frackibacter sp. T328-2]
MDLKEDGLKEALWSVAIPGFGQILNEKYFKGFILITLELLINIQSNMNIAIIASFRGNTCAAVQQTNYQWLMFYPSIYLFGIWDAYNDAINSRSPCSFLPFTMAAYLGTIGIIYSKDIKIMGVLLGPIWLPLEFMFIGGLLGLIICNFFKIY